MLHDKEDDDMGPHTLSGLGQECILTYDLY